MRPRTLIVPVSLAMVLSAAPAVTADHNGNVRVVALARQLAQEADACARRAERAVGWYGDWTDRRAVEELRQFASYTRSLHAQALRLEPGNPPPGPPPPPPTPDPQDPPPHDDHPAVAPTGVRVGVLDHNDEDIGRQLFALFRSTWHQADNVEYYLYAASWRLQSAVRSHWDYRLCTTLRQLRAALGGVNPYAAREDGRVTRFEALTARR